jgi:hypothetical protein
VACTQRQGIRLCACPMRRFLTATFLLLVLLPAAHALAADNPSDLLVDACRDEKVDGTYSQRTFRRALDQLPADSDQYTACRDVINRARLAALDRSSNSSGSGNGSGGGGGGGSTGSSSGSGGGGGNATSGSGSGSANSTPTPSCNGCKGSGTALDTATPAERKGVRDATSSGSKPVRLGGQLLTPGAVGSLSSDSNRLPTPLIVLLAALAAFALAVAGVTGWNHVLARRTR